MLKSGLFKQAVTPFCTETSFRQKKAERKNTLLAAPPAQAKPSLKERFD
ncbi:MAG TPA: hypothetical protein PLG15_01910 [Candidatus Gastranaerophilaceae bacterium]|nr:hypothetical protein [Candidatus Gastranaerophilaceae bacterium]